MNHDFQKKLELYKEGKLNENQVSELEAEIDKFTALQEYLKDDDNDLFEELKNITPTKTETKDVKRIKRGVNIRLISTTIIIVLATLVTIQFLYRVSSNITSSLFALDHKERFVESQKIGQLVQMFHPQYELNGIGGYDYGFAKQAFQTSSYNKVGNTLIEEFEIKINYSFGKPIKVVTGPAKEPVMLDWGISPLRNHYDPLLGFEPLENAPQGTKAQIFILFKEALTASELQNKIISQLNVDTVTLDFTPVVIVDSIFLIANSSYFQFTPVYPYDTNNAKLLEDNPDKQELYESMDDEAHQESLIQNLHLIKDNERLLQAMYYVDMLDGINIDDAIGKVEQNGAEYVGMYISADSKELLELKGHPNIGGITVENIVLW